MNMKYLSKIIHIISEICFEASNWDVLSVFFMNEDGYYNEVKGDIYGYDGNMIAGNSFLRRKTYP